MFRWILHWLLLNGYRLEIKVLSILYFEKVSFFLTPRFGVKRIIMLFLTAGFISWNELNTFMKFAIFIVLLPCHMTVPPKNLLSKFHIHIDRNAGKTFYPSTLFILTKGTTRVASHFLLQTVSSFVTLLYYRSYTLVGHCSQILIICQLWS